MWAQKLVNKWERLFFTSINFRTPIHFLYIRMSYKIITQDNHLCVTNLMQIFPVCCLFICIAVLNFNIFKSVHFFFTGCFFWSHENCHFYAELINIKISASVSIIWFAIFNSPELTFDEGPIDILLYPNHLLNNLLNNSSSLTYFEISVYLSYS